MCAVVLLRLQVQKPDIANPPTMFLAVESLIAHTLEVHGTADVQADGSVASVETKATLDFVRCVLGAGIDRSRESNRDSANVMPVTD